MIRVILFLVVVAALGLGFGWLADRPGDLVFTFAGERHNISLMVAASLVVAVTAGAMLLWWIVKNLIRSPYILQRHFRARKRDRGYQSLSTGLIAAGAGDAEAARRMSKQAAKLLRADQEPLIRLLDAQTALLEGRKDDVRRHFEAMIADPETKLLGLRGLYLEANREGVREAAFQYAQEAITLAPQLEWASNAVLGHKVLEGDVSGALRVLEARKAVIPYGKDGKAAREALNRNRAVLLTAQAMHDFDTDAVASRDAANEAYKLEPELIPAALIAARCLLRDGNIRKGNRILEAAWKREPHPEIAEAYIHGRAGDTALDRLKKARLLAGLRSNHAESALIVAQAALDAGELKLARENAEAALRLTPRESAYLLMADIEEAQTGDQGRVREWLARAVKAPRDPAWTADGVVSAHWAPASPVTGRLNAFEWKVPLTEITTDTSPVLEGEDLTSRILPVGYSGNQQSEADRNTVDLAAVDPVFRDDIDDAEMISVVPEPQRTQPKSEPQKTESDLRTAKVTILSEAPDNPVVQNMKEKQAEDIRSQDEKHSLIVDDPGVNADTELPVRKESTFRLF
ncbi:heme biosynthesis protein HemY [Pseudochrobactrum sp. sp1633]|uniref:heme biosynthesis protein HemY n=1 Tax=Pseudochrobactrum sp. sp1633 TaxID=3036706 RepID=UPI0025A4E83D|nr:heme biosynthesis protein HemY [Pseudochrobactrum sp. sp1633]MDM8345074.1 heme biosynthesis protein HemY [Pseudochrobactrum sp. sp1633]HWD14907.1 heme biosynthesis protein HemY [Pseudochrobactrum sp.]